MIEAELVSLCAANPWMSVWPVRQILNGIAQMVTNKIFGKLRLVVDMGAISFVNQEHKAAFDKAAVTLKIIAQDKGIESDEYKRAREDAKTALSRFLRYGA